VDAKYAPACVGCDGKGGVETSANTDGIGGVSDARAMVGIATPSEAMRRGRGRSLLPGDHISSETPDDPPSFALSRNSSGSGSDLRLFAGLGPVVLAAFDMESAGADSGTCESGCMAPDDADRNFGLCSRCGRFGSFSGADQGVGIVPVGYWKEGGGMPDCVTAGEYSAPGEDWPESEVVEPTERFGE
jgi:hypothetical protein